MACFIYRAEIYQSLIFTTHLWRGIMTRTTEISEDLRKRIVYADQAWLNGENTRDLLLSPEVLDLKNHDKTKTSLWFKVQGNGKPLDFSIRIRSQELWWMVVVVLSWFGNVLVHLGQDSLTYCNSQRNCHDICPWTESQQKVGHVARQHAKAPRLFSQKIVNDNEDNDLNGQVNRLPLIQ